MIRNRIMILRRIVKIMLLVLVLCLVSGVALYLYNAHHNYTINSGFSPLPLVYNPDDSSSAYRWQGADITIYGGFVKGIQRNGKNGDSLVLRALSPLPVIEIRASEAIVQNLSVTIENIHPDTYAASVRQTPVPTRISVNSLEYVLDLNAGETRRLDPGEPVLSEFSSYVVLGDSRDGYDTFGQMIDQSDGLNPAFVIDNGDLVYSGKPNQYRLFDRLASRLTATLCTTLGNHDMRGNGRDTYTRLYGPAYYSFDYGENHFVFLDSAPGWTQNQAISNEQYAWLERDMKKAGGKRIYVITHIPPTDPRENLLPNTLSAFIDKVEPVAGYIERYLNKYSSTKAMNHGFQDAQEAARFEGLMTLYKVDTVYLSHIHSYFDYEHDGVRYIISGGAGAELMTKNSYYHYLIAKISSRDSITMVQFPSPANALLNRYATTVSLFAEAMYLENPVSVILFLVGLGLLVLLFILLLVVRHHHWLALFWILVKDTGKYALNRYKELHNGKGKD